jgi:hypothetical protein
MFNFNRQIFFKKISLEKSKTITENIEVNLDVSDCSSIDSQCDSLDCVFSKFCKKKRNFSHLAYLKESMLFELELLKSLEDLKLKVFFNISLKEFKILKHFVSHKPFKIIQLDKNVGAGIISNELYVELANKVFDDSNTYEKLDSNPLDEAKEKIYDLLLELYSKNDISKKLFELLKPNSGKLGNASLLAKIHKPVFDLRQIINYKDHITAPISIIIDGILFPLVKTFPCFILDSQNLMQKAELYRANKNSKLVTADVVSLYSSIDHKDCIKRVTDFIKDKFSSEHLTLKGFKNILKILLKFNIFKFNGSYYKQILGIAMGSKCGPALANTFVYTYEKIWLDLYKPSFYARFIDDVLMVVESLDILNSFKNAFGSLKLTLNIGIKVEYLDLIVKINPITFYLNFEIFFKKTNTFSYLLTNSNHPNFIFKNIPKSLFIRIRRNCTFFSDFLKNASIVSNQLLSRGYDRILVEKAFHMVAFLDRKKLLIYKEKKRIDFRNCIFFKNVFDNNISNINCLTRNVFKNVIKEEEDLKALKIFMVNKMQPNLKLILVNDFKIPQIYKNFYMKCKKLNCITCKFADTSYYVQLTEKFILPIFDNSNCLTDNCIYFLNCKLCKGIYVGQTKNFKKRFASHRHKIKTFVPFEIPFCCVATHFNLKFHFNDIHLRFFIIKKNIEWLEYRLCLESFFMNLCKNLGVNLLNDYIPPIKTLIKR